MKISPPPKNRANSKQAGKKEGDPLWKRNFCPPAHRAEGAVEVGSGSSLRQQESKARRQTASRWAGLPPTGRQLKVTIRIFVKRSSNIVQKTPLKGDGDFRSEESIELLKQADIVVTNPPFSLFREYVAQLVEYNKKFLMIGNTNAITYKEIFKLIKDDKLRTGYTNFNVGMFF